MLSRTLAYSNGTQKSLERGDIIPLLRRKNLRLRATDLVGTRMYLLSYMFAVGFPEKSMAVSWFQFLPESSSS